MDIVNRARNYLERNGAGDTFFTGLQHIRNAGIDFRYNSQAKKGGRLLPEASPEDIKKLKLSVLVPVYEPDLTFFEEMTASVLNQSWDNFELIFADGSPVEDLRIIKLARCDERIRYIRSTPGGGISVNSNTALKAARGDVVVFLDQDDLIEEDAFYKIASEFLNGADIVYTDEDKYITAKNCFARPYRKRDYSLRLLLTNNYICHMFAVRRLLAKKAGGFDERFDGAQDHDLILRCCDMTQEEKIVHVREVLYHWRAHERSTASNPGAKLYAYESGKNAVKHFLSRKNIDACVKDTAHSGFFRVEYNKEIPEDSYMMYLREDLKPLDEKQDGEYEKILASYFAFPDVGIVGARVISPMGRIIESGYEKDENGRIIPLFYGKDYRMPGEFNLACLPMDVEAVSKYACVVRAELAQYMQGDSYSICEKIRQRGFHAVIDPRVVFVRR